MSRIPNAIGGDKLRRGDSMVRTLELAGAKYTDRGGKVQRVRASTRSSDFRIANLSAHIALLAIVIGVLFSRTVKITCLLLVGRVPTIATLDAWRRKFQASIRAETRYEAKFRGYANGDTSHLAQ